MSPSTPTTPEVMVDPLYPRLKGFLIESTGLAYYSNKDEDLAERVRRRLLHLGMSNCGAYQDFLGSPSGAAELDTLIAELTIGETYFFRYTEQWDALRDTVLPAIITDKRDSRRLRIWSAGCATGPEPYSLSILLKHEFGDRLAGWDVTILGTDINRQFLARAREGQFEEWALRSLPDHLKRRCFSPAGKAWVIAPPYRQWVSFQYHNLVEHPFPSMLNNIFAFDLILCRNVMIYFSAEIIQKLIAQFKDSLVDRGWLLVGHAEPNLEYFRSFRLVNAPGTPLYQKLSQGGEGSEGVTEWGKYPDAGIQGYPGAAPPTHQFTIALPEISTPLAVMPLERLTTSSGEQHTPTEVETIRSYADHGNWEMALQICQNLLKKDQLNPIAHFYSAVIMEGLARPDDCERSLRQAIYLDRSFVLAHYHLGIFLQDKGDTRGAERSFQNVLTLLAKIPGDHPFPDGEGVTAAGLRKLAEMQVQVLRKT